MTLVRFDCILWMDSGLPEDYASNTWWINTTATDPEVGTAAFQADITTFYLAIDSYLSADLEGTIAFRAYNMAEDPPRVPFHIDGMAAAPGTDRLPSEVALCTSFAADPESGLIQARRRGRVFIGPLSSSALDSTTGRPAAGFRTALADATEALAVASAGDAAYDWVVYSTVQNTWTPVERGFVDNAFDTQRRRGLAATARTTWP